MKFKMGFIWPNADSIIKTIGKCKSIQ